MRFPAGALSLFFVFAMAAKPTRAQGPAGADTLSPAAVADSQRVLSTLTQRLAANANDAAAWFRSGMIAWALADRARAPNPPPDLDPTRLGVLADTSLRLAAHFAPDSVLYHRMAGQFLLASGVATARHAAEMYFKSAVDAGKRVGAAQHAAALVDYGRAHWLRYDAVAYRWTVTSGAGALKSVGEVMMPPCVRDPLNPCAPRPISDVRQVLTTGAMPIGMDYMDLEIAEAAFRDAHGLQPSDARAFHWYAMSIAERAKWPDLERVARARTAASPRDAWGWLVLGLATHRQRNDVDAAPAFERGLSLLSPAERDRLDRLARVLPSDDTSRRVRGTPAERAAYQRLYWAMADPLWTKHGSETRNEFLSRVTFAELRWTVEDMYVRGADTDRGSVFIRYGPPDIQASFGYEVGAAEISLVWIYGTELAFVFTGQSGFGTMRSPPNDVRLVHGISQSTPVQWNNVVRPEIDSIPTQVARFRGAGDSVDVFVAAELHPAPILASRSVNEPVRGEMWLRTTGATTFYVDSATLERDEMKTWRVRVPPTAFLLRVQVMAEHASRAARAMGVIDATRSPTGVTLPGMAMSDVVFATRIEPRQGAASRWSDFDVAPIAGSIARGASLALLWENYELGARDGSARYTVTVTVRRERSGIGRIAARVAGGLARAARVAQAEDRATITYDRTAPHANAIVDYVSVSLLDTPPGDYVVSVQVTDAVTGRSVVRSRPLVIRP